MWNPKDDPRGTRNSPIFKIMNPELHTKPNLKVATAGTTLFVFLLGSLIYEKYKYDKEQEKLKKPALERVIKEE